MPRVSQLVISFLVFILPLLLYVLTLAPTYIPIDSAEFTLCIKFWGVCHPPGFPLYTTLGKFFVEIFPLGSLVFKANLFSSILGALTVLLVFLSLLKLSVPRFTAFLMALLLSVNVVFWEFSIAADVFTFTTFLISLCFWLVLNKRILLAFFVLGLLTSHFYITAILAPFFIWYFWGFKPKFKNIMGVGLVFLLGLFPQALLFIRIGANPEINWGHVQGIAGFWHFIRREEFGSFFLLSNPVLKFGFDNFFKHLFFFLKELTFSFGLVLPAVTLAVLLFLRKLFLDRIGVLILLCFLVIIAVQLMLLSTIDPTDKDSSFQIAKFYLLSFVFFILIAARAITFLSQKFFKNELYPGLLLGFLVLIFLFANFRVNNFSGNYFSQNMVLDALEQLPPNSIAITVHHVFYFGGLYEQKINGKFSDIKLLYFPNEKNRDNEFYQPDLFSRPPDQQFINRVQKGKNLGKAEKYILGVIARNLDKDIFILQGTFEERFFSYLKPYISSYGLWWKIEPDLIHRNYLEASINNLKRLRNGHLKFTDLEHNNQKLDLLIYVVAYRSTGIALAAQGNYDEAIEFLNKSYNIRPVSDKIPKEIELIKQTQSAETKADELADKKDKINLMELGNSYYILGNYESCVKVLETVTEFETEDAKVFNNLGSCYASFGKKEEARANYLKALDLDPNLDLAKRGLEALQ